MKEVLISIASMVGMGIFFASILAIADKTMSVKEDKRISDIEEILPGLNCGACGYSGCRLFAIALSKGEVFVTGCLPGGAETATNLADLLGVEKKEVVKSVAVLHCNADFDQRKRYADYKGIETCNAANRILNGGVACKYGCLGYGDCSTVCPVGAIKIANGLPIVDSTTCTSCGRCLKACPRKLFSIEKFLGDEIATVACSSLENAALVRKVCGVGCIGCKICEKLTEGAFKVKDNLAKVNYGKAKPDANWNKAIEKCPTKVIVKIT